MHENVSLIVVCKNVGPLSRSKCIISYSPSDVSYDIGGKQVCWSSYVTFLNYYVEEANKGII